MRFALVLVVIVGCGTGFPGGGEPEDTSAPPPDGRDDSTEPTGWSRTGCGPAPAQERDWDHFGSSLSSIGEANHGAADAVARAGQPVAIEARFTYSIVAKDLENETIELWLADGDCQWQLHSAAITDDDGIARFELAGPALAAGAYAFEAVAPGDLSRAGGALWIVPESQPVVVFDIDGTLTTGDSELVEDLVGDDAPNMRPSADEVVQLWSDLGFLPIYITGRPQYLDDSTQAWLDDRRFPAGPLFVSVGLREAVLDVEAFKTGVLVDLRDRAGVDIERAYGNASTDVCAYARSGIAPSETFIIGDHAGEACDGFDPSIAVTGYPEHLEELLAP
ncbi:MAG: hypothetical protein KJO07_14215 [Deltaproteobacteria bacterium]|nr:hypothetical protein [Deltaproteobacteria bacterium]